MALPSVGEIQDSAVTIRIYLEGKCMEWESSKNRVQEFLALYLCGGNRLYCDVTTVYRAIAMIPRYG